MQATKEVKIRSSKELVKPLPFEQREWIRLSEIPTYLIHYYNLRVGLASVHRWRKEGMVMKGQHELPEDKRTRVTLLAEKRANRWFVKKADLEAFLSAT